MAVEKAAGTLKSAGNHPDLSFCSKRIKTRDTYRIPENSEHVPSASYFGPAAAGNSRAFLLELSDTMKRALAIFTSLCHQAVDMGVEIYLLSS